MKFFNMAKASLVTSLFATLCAAQVFADSAPISSVTTADEVEWGYLNPLRGDKSPGAADLWGDRTKNTATGMLVRFKKGFSSPPHIHNISYRGVVIAGKMHNDDPSAEFMWLPTGSFWTQPAGENHITAANGETNLIYLEIDSGPYLVKPSAQHFDNGEHPINQHIDNMVWEKPNDSTWLNKGGAQLTHLWGNNIGEDTAGTLVKIPAGYSGELQGGAGTLRFVVISGSVQYSSKETPEAKTLKPASYVASNAPFVHNITADADTLIYVRADRKFKVLTQRDKT